MFTHWNLFVLNKYNRDVRSDVGRYEDSGAVCAAVVSVAAGFSEGVSLTAGVSVASSMSAGVCLAAKETGRMWSDGAREDGSVTPGMLGSVEGRTVCMGRGEMPGRFRGGRGGKPAEREISDQYSAVLIKSQKLKPVFTMAGYFTLGFCRIFKTLLRTCTNKINTVCLFRTDIKINHESQIPLLD